MEQGGGGAYSGARVPRATVSSLKSAGRAKSNLDSKVTSVYFSSIMASPCPTQFLSPIPNGIKKGIVLVLPSGEMNLAGLNVSGSFHRSLLLCKWVWLIEINVCMVAALENSTELVITNPSRDLEAPELERSIC